MPRTGRTIVDDARQGVPHGTPALERLLRPIDAASRQVARVAMLLAYLLMAVMVFEVVARYGLARPTIWAFDVSYMLNGSLFALGLAWTLRAGEHVRIDFLSTQLPRRLQNGILAAVYGTLVLPAVGWLALSAFRTALRAWRTGEVEAVSPWAPLMWPFYAVLAAGLIVLALQLVAETLRHLTAAARG
jgi:TRAP-type mannitol/chloroaromatic compound transport system permease small subunit